MWTTRKCNSQRGKKYLGSLRMRAGRVSSIEVNCVYTYYILPTYTVRTVPPLPLVSFIERDKKKEENNISE